MIRKAWLVLAVMAAVLAFPGAAFAHVEITAADPPGEDDVVLTSLFVEAECPSYTASAQLVFPESPELTVATPDVVEGWTSAVEKVAGSEAVAGVTWTNTGQVEGDGEFRLALGPIAVDEEPINFKAIQTCDDGEVIRWIEEGEDGEFPAPVLTLSHDGHTDDGHHDEATTDTKAESKPSDDSDSSTGVIIGVVAAVVVLGGAAFAISRRKK